MLKWILAFIVVLVSILLSGASFALWNESKDKEYEDNRVFCLYTRVLAIVLAGGAIACWMLVFVIAIGG